MNLDNPLLSSYEEIMRIMNLDEKNELSTSRDYKLAEEKGCSHCDILKQMLILAEKRYDRLQAENFAGELTISCLRSKNKELRKKLSDRNNHTSTKCSSFDEDDTIQKKELRQATSENNLTCLENFIDTFNPKELKKILSERAIDFPSNANQRERNSSK